MVCSRGRICPTLRRHLPVKFKVHIKLKAIVIRYLIILRVWEGMGWDGCVVVAFFLVLRFVVLLQDVTHVSALIRDIL